MAPKGGFPAGVFDSFNFRGAYRKNDYANGESGGSEITLTGNGTLPAVTGSGFIPSPSSGLAPQLGGAPPLRKRVYLTGYGQLPAFWSASFVEVTPLQIIETPPPAPITARARGVLRMPVGVAMAFKGPDPITIAARGRTAFVRGLGTASADIIAEDELLAIALLAA